MTPCLLILPPYPNFCIAKFFDSLLAAKAEFAPVTLVMGIDETERGEQKPCIWRYSNKPMKYPYVFKLLAFMLWPFLLVFLYYLFNKKRFQKTTGEFKQDGFK